jgi:ankyrin repeat protein
MMSSSNIGRRDAELESESDYGQTPLSLAAGNGHKAAVKLLLEKGARKLYTLKERLRSCCNQLTIRDILHQQQYG